MRGWWIDARYLSAALGLVLLTAVASAGYVWLEGWAWGDAIYMSVITLSTVGYGEVAPLGPGGRAYTAAVIVVGVGFALTAATLIGDAVVDARLRNWFPGRNMEDRIQALRDHIIVCGHGRYGAVVVAELRRAARPLIVVERDAERLAGLEEEGVPCLCGNAASDEVLRRAGVERASAIVVATASDADNVFITLSAREWNPEIEIHARGESDTALRRLRNAGAASVTSLSRQGGLRTAAQIVRPSVVDVLDLSADPDEAVELEEIRVLENAPIAGRTVGAAEAASGDCRILALKRRGLPLQAPPPAELEIAADDQLVVIGDRLPVARLADAAAPG